MLYGVRWPAGLGNQPSSYYKNAVVDQSLLKLQTG